MILSDTDIRKALADGRIVISPLDDTYVQPSSIDLRVDRYFRVFRNDTTPYIDPKQAQEDLTELVEVAPGKAFILHPGEFVLGSTLEVVTLGDDLVARLEGKSSLGRLGLLIHSSLPGDEEVVILCDGEVRTLPIETIVRKRIEGSVVGFDPQTHEPDFRPITGWFEGPADRIFEVRLDSGRKVRVTAGHNLFSLGRDGLVAKVRTGQLRPGARVAVAQPLPGASTDPPLLDLRLLVPDADVNWLTVRGPAVEEALRERSCRDLLNDSGYGDAIHYRRAGVLPLPVALLVPGLISALGPDDRMQARRSRHGLPVVTPIDTELAWLLGAFVSAGHVGHAATVISHGDAHVLDRARSALAALGLTAHRRGGTALSASSAVLASLPAWLGLGLETGQRRIPRGALGWPDHILEALLEGIRDGERPHGRPSTYRAPARGLASDLLLAHARLGHPAAARDRDGAYEVVVGEVLVDEVLVDGAGSPSLQGGAGLAWDTVTEVVDTGENQPIFDLEVRPGGHRIENFVAGHGGVYVSNTAGFVDAGFSGHLTLELSNVANLPIAIYPGMKIGQISFITMTSPAATPYGSKATGSKYQGQRGPTPSRYYLNFVDDNEQ